MSRVRIAAGTVVALACVGTVHADGYLPAAPYNYLHPPRGIGKNHHPAAITATEKLRHGRTTRPTVVFTRDGQAGIDAHAGKLRAAGGARELRVRIAPVNPPRPIPGPRLLDGNAYRFSAAGTPGRHAVTVLAPFSIVLRWPHSPVAVLQFARGHWRSLCTFGHWTLSISTVACKARSLGTFAAVHVSSRAAR